MRFNPAASYDLGMYQAAGSLDAEDMSRITDVYRDFATMRLAARSFDHAYDMYIVAQITASEEDAACRCIDCGGTQFSHAPSCAFMNALFGED